MKILFISDYSLEHNKGGAQRSNDLIIKRGRELGHEVKCFHFDCDPTICNEEYDHVISSNLQDITRFHPNIISWLYNQPAHSRLEHDKNAYLTPDQRRMLFSKCKNTFFLSRYHHELFKTLYGDFFTNVKIVHDPIDTDLFYDKKLVREEKTLGVGFMHYLKGSDLFFNVVRSNPDKQFVVAGWGLPEYVSLARSCPNVEFLGVVEYSDMPNLYNKYSNLFYHPITEEPFCRSVGEAAPCGIKQHVPAGKNGAKQGIERLGLDGFKEGCKTAADSFWKIITDENTISSQ